MPPDSKKRPADTPITPPPNKRASWASLISSSKSLSVAVDNVSKKYSKGPVMDLSAALPAIAPESYASPIAVELFREVKTTQQFRIAARVFWITYSAYQRGQTSQNIIDLLQLVSEKSGKTGANWYEASSEYYQIWQSEHNAVAAAYESKFKKYVDKWMDSPAGRNYLSVISKNRVKKIALPPPLKTADLKAWNFTANSKSGTETFTGIEWTHRQIYDIFSILGDVTETIEVTEPLGSPDVKTRVDGEKPEGHDLDRWFVYDLPAIKRATGPPALGSVYRDSWYSRLSAVASAVILNLIHMEFGMLDVRGKKTFLRDDSCRKLMLRIPTPKHPDDKAWPIDGDPLQAWVTYFEEKFDPEEESRPMRPTDVIQTDYQAFKAGETRQMTHNELEQHQRQGERVDNELQQRLSTKNTAAGIDPPILHRSDMMDPSSYPAPPKYPPEVTEFVAIFQSSNIYGQASMMDAKLSREIRRLQLLIENCKTRQAVLAKQKVDLMIKVKSIVKVEKMLDNQYNQMKEEQDEVEKMQLKVADAETDPEIREFLNREVQIHRQTPNGMSMVIDKLE